MNDVYGRLREKQGITVADVVAICCYLKYTMRTFELTSVFLMCMRPIFGSPALLDALLEQDGVLALTRSLSIFYHNHAIVYHSLWSLLKICSLRPASVTTLARIEGMDRLLLQVSLECTGYLPTKDLALQLLVMLFVSAVRFA